MTMFCNESGITDLDDKKQSSVFAHSKPTVVSEDQLQNLDLETDNALPKFKLNEPGPSALASSIFQHNNMVNDETEESFIILGKTILDCIKETSLNSYIEIQSKTENTDHSSLISMMSPIEIEENLKKVLDENMKLKETLKQNNDSIKKQFNTITMWQKDVMTVCDNHKQKFLETKELINRLKKENDNLRVRIDQNHSQEGPVSNMINFSQGHSKNVLISSQSDIVSQEINKPQEISTSTNNEQMLLSKIDSLSEELSKVNVNYSQNSQKFLQELGKLYVNDINSQQLDKVNKELEDLKQKCDTFNHTKLKKLASEYYEIDTELKDLKKIISSMEDIIKTYEQNAISSTDIQLQTSEKDSKEKHVLKENIEFYSTELKELSRCFLSQYSHYVQIQEFLKESVKIIQIFENSKVLSNNLLSEDKIKNYKDKLCDYRQKLIQEQMQNIKDKQATMKIHQKFHKLLSDYNSVIYELEILKDENFKLTIQTQIEKKKLDIDKSSLLEERLNLQLEKRNIVEDKKKIESDYNSIEVQKNELAESRTSLLAEKTSLDCQSRLYEIEKNNQDKENKILNKKCEDISNELDRVRQELSEAKTCIEQCQIKHNLFKEHNEVISAYQIQIEINEKDFEQMVIKEKELQDQVQSLSMENLKLRSKLCEIE